MDFSVAICTYNGATRIPEVLEALQAQTQLGAIAWEILVVDNNSTDDTAAVVARYAQAWSLPHSEIRYCFEGRQGVTYARQRAVAEAHSGLIGFLDDDNLPDPTWVAAAHAFGQSHPQAGAYGAIVRAKLDAPPPDYFEQAKNLIAIQDRGPEPFCYQRTAKPRRIPIAPGSVVRKQAWQQSLPPRLLLGGRDEKHQTFLGSCEDLEVLYYIQNGPWEVWHNPAMVVWHHIPPHRFEAAYLRKLARTSGLSNHALRIARLQQPWQRALMPVLTLGYLAVDAYKVAAFYLQFRGQLAVDPGKAWEMEARLGRLLSPWMFWGRRREEGQ